MTIWFVHRRGDGTIASAHQPDADGNSPMPDYCNEKLDDASGELADWFATVNAPPPEPSPAEKLASAGLTVEELRSLLGLPPA